MRVCDFFAIFFAIFWLEGIGLDRSLLATFNAGPWEKSESVGRS